MSFGEKPARRFGGFLVAALAGCAAQAKPPEAVFSEISAVLRGGDDAALYRLLSPADQARIPFAAFHQRREEEREDLAALGKRLAATDAPITIETAWETTHGDHPRVVVEHGQAHIDPNALYSLSPRTPEEALSCLRYALLQLVRNDVLSVFSTDTKKSIANELSPILESLENPHAVPIAEAGDRAVATLQAGHQVRLVRVDGVWKIDSFE